MSLLEGNYVVIVLIIFSFLPSLIIPTGWGRLPSACNGAVGLSQPRRTSGPSRGQTIVVCNSRGILGRFFVVFIHYQHFLTPLVWVRVGVELETLAVGSNTQPLRYAAPCYCFDYDNCIISQGHILSFQNITSTIVGIFFIITI